jgi:hypothetical protein
MLTKELVTVFLKEALTVLIFFLALLAQPLYADGI